jgi:hypothetical protein
MEVNSTEPFPSVRVPCIAESILINLFAKGKGYDPLSLTSAESSLEIGEIPLSFDKFKGLSVFLYVY